MVAAEVEKLNVLLDFEKVYNFSTISVALVVSVTLTDAVVDELDDVRENAALSTGDSGVYVQEVPLPDTSVSVSVHLKALGARLVVKVILLIL